jgi:hypothetical protein
VGVVPRPKVEAQHKPARTAMKEVKQLKVRKIETPAAE